MATKNAVGRPRKYTPRTLLQAEIAWFQAITYPIPAVDDDGRRIISNDGRPATVTGWIQPPTVASMCLDLGIDRSTWENYCDKDLHPEYAGAVEYARMRMLAYNEAQLLTRDRVNGIIFNLQNNYGWAAKEKREVELGEKTRSAVKAAEMTLDDKLAMIAAASRDLSEAGYAEDDESG